VTPARQAGSDNPYARWSPIAGRRPLRWPDDAAVAVSVIVSVEHLEWEPAPDAVPAPISLSYGPYPRAFQLTGVSRAEYGSRVGAFRLLDALDQTGITPTVAMDAALMADRQRLVDEFLDRGSEFIGHGMALSRTLSERMTEQAERADIVRSLELIEAATGARPAGWLGGDYGESTRTVRLLAEQGIGYVCDWPNDEQPYPLEADGRRLVSLPVTVDLDDVMAQKVRRLPPSRWAHMVIEALARLRTDGAGGSGRLLVLNLHAHVSGQPFRIRYVDEVLRALSSAGGVWMATAGEIADWYQRDLDRSEGVG
jgi:allantoinase